jgi:ribosomal protein S18 acetylase RimI-like enzyme
LIEEISKSNIEDLDKLDTIISEFFDRMKEKYNQSAYPLKEILKKGLLDSKVKINVGFDDNSIPIGFSFIHKSEGKFGVILNRSISRESSYSLLNVMENTLFDEAFNELKTTHSNIRIAQEISYNLEQYARSNGFTNYKRARMSITKETIDTLKVAVIDSSFSFDAWNAEFENDIAKIIAKYHFSPKNPDGILFSQYSGVDGTKRLLKQITESRFGKFTSTQTRILKHLEKPVGMCSVTKLDTGNGYIPEIVLSPQYKGKGIGKALLVHSLKHFMNEESTAPMIELDVTLKNFQAANLYETLGFEQMYTYTVLVWMTYNASLKK